MAEEPTLPGPRPRLLNGSVSSRSFKRSRLHSSPPLSSDPPVFSSDDDPSADNYIARERAKKRYRGPWHDQRPYEEERAATRPFRHFDSGICIGSDSTDADSDAEFSSRVQLSQPMSGLQRIVMRPAPMLLVKPTAEELVQQEIEKCLEEGKEDVDLSGRNLTSLSNGTIKPLSTLVKVPTASQGHEIEFRRLRPALKLFLSKNQLRRAPGEIFKLRGLSVLSLRSNQLVELPDTIGYLQKLVELNVANNNLHCLPYDILELLSDKGRLEILTVHPNQFYEPLEDIVETPPPSSPVGPNIGLYRPSTPQRAVKCVPPPVPFQWLEHWDIQYRCRSQVRFMDLNGCRMKGPELTQDESLFSSSDRPTQLSSAQQLLIPVAPADDIPEPPRNECGSRTSRAPSLQEIAVRTWSQNPDLPSLQDWLGSDDPVHLIRVLDDASTLREFEAGDRKCTICKRIYVIPRTEWIEWWEIGRREDERLRMRTSAASPLRYKENKRDEAERCIPLMRRGCSWKCVPEKVVLEDEAMITTDEGAA